MDTFTPTSRRALLRSILGAGAAGAALIATPVAVLAGTDQTNDVEEGAVNIAEGSTAVKCFSTQGAAFVGQSTTGLPGLFGYSAASDTGNPDSGDDFSGVVGLGFGAGAVGVTARQGGGADAALAVFGRARFSRSGRATISAGNSSRTVSLSKVTPASLVFAVLATNVTGRQVRAVVPAAGSFTIHLNGTVGTPAAVSWIVFDPPT